MLNKIIAIAVFLVGMQTVSFAQSILEEQVTLVYENKSLGYILEDIERRYETIFSYRVFDLNLIKSIDYAGSMEQGLATLLHPENIVFKAIGRQIVLRLNPALARKLKGVIVDEVTRQPLIGASVTVLHSNPLLGTTTDLAGQFEISNLFIGRYDLLVQYLGYQDKLVNQVLITSGKQVSLEISMSESIVALNEVVVIGKRDLRQPLNTMATNSARSFSVEETKRYAAAIADPARMAQSYAGVSSGGDDLSNEIIIRGNSARGLLWRLEGIEIPSPNHFAGYVSGGGAISMLSATTLANSDFYTGAFPAEFGNALSGVFDLRMRVGNNKRREHSLAIGNLGIEASSEGYFSRKSDASYLINYRYSTLQLIDEYLLSVTEIPNYRDLSFKLFFPYKKGHSLSVFGLGGINNQYRQAIRDSMIWVTSNDQLDFNEDQSLAIIGATYRHILSEQSHLTFSTMFSHFDFHDLTEVLLPKRNYQPLNIDETILGNRDLISSLVFNHKFTAKNNIRAGISMNQKWFSYQFISTGPLSSIQEVVQSENPILLDYLQDKGATSFQQVFFQWHSKLSREWEIKSGVNMSFLGLNDKLTIDPRLGVSWKFATKQRVGLSLGLHSKPEHNSSYFIQPLGQDQNKNFQDLEIPRAFHAVGSYDFFITEKLRFKAEAYFQFLYHIPVSNDPSSGFSTLNVEDIFDVIFDNNQGGGFLESEGKGRNFGLDLTFEKFFSDNYYFLCTGSIFQSQYTPRNEQWYPTIYSNNTILNVLGGKEWVLGKLDQNILGLNGKFTYYGGRRDNPIDLQASRTEDRRINIPDQYYSKKLAPYLRLDFGIRYTMNTGRFTHSISLDLQNVTDRRNITSQFYDSRTQQIQFFYQNGLIPFFTYRFQFSSGDKIIKK